MYFQSNRQGLEAKGQKRGSGASVLYSWHLSFGQRCLSSFREAHHVPHRLFELHKWTPTGDSADTTCCTVAGTAGTERTRCSCLVPQGGSKLGSVLEPKGWNTMELIATSKDMCALKTHIIHLIQHIFFLQIICPMQENCLAELTHCFYSLLKLEVVQALHCGTLHILTKSRVYVYTVFIFS